MYLQRQGYGHFIPRDESAFSSVTLGCGDTNTSLVPRAVRCSHLHSSRNMLRQPVTSCSTLIRLSHIMNSNLFPTYSLRFTHFPTNYSPFTISHLIYYYYYYYYYYYIRTIEINADELLNACKDIGLAVNTRKTKYMEIGRHRGMILNEHLKQEVNIIQSKHSCLLDFFLRIRKLKYI